MSTRLTLGVLALIQKGHLPFAERLIQPETVSLLMGISITSAGLSKYLRRIRLHAVRFLMSVPLVWGFYGEAVQRGDTGTALLLREKQMNLIQYLGKFSSAS